MAGGPRTRWLHRPWAQAGLARLVVGYIHLLERSGRWQLTYDQAVVPLIDARQPFIGACWHGRMLMVFSAWRAMVAELAVSPPLRAYVMSSPHGDGRLIGLITARFGLRTVWGSSQRSGAEAFRAAQRVIADGDIVAITPDGPLGPRMRAQRGVVLLAKRTGVPIVPITFAASNQRMLDSWDRFAVALPFARGTLAFGAPLEIARDVDLEAARLMLERRLTELTAAVDQGLGLPPVAPDG